MPDSDAPADRPRLSATAILVRLGVIGAAVLGSAAAFAYTGGWLSPHRLTQDRIIDAFQSVNGPHPGFRRNHAKGICALGWFDSTGQAAPLSKAALFEPGRTPVVARIAFAGGMPFVADAPELVRSLAIRFLPANGEEWRTGMIDIPVFPVRTPEAFYEQLLTTKPDPATGKPDPEKGRAFAAAHPEFVAAIGIIGHRQISSGFANATYNALHTFHFISADGAVTPVRWSAVPVQPFEPAAEAGVGSDKNAMFDALIANVAQRPVQWRLMVTVGRPGDTIDPTRLWPQDRQQIEAGTVTIDRVASEDDGPCLNVNYDPTILPSGIALSDDPIPGARAAAYSRSFTLREGERAEKPPSAVTPQEVAAGGK